MGVGDWPMSPDAPVGPALLVNRLGKGTVVTIAASPDFSVAGDHHIVEARKLLRNVVRFLNRRPVVEIAAPVNVEAVVTRDPGGGTLRVHFIACNSPPQTTPVRERPYVLPGLIEDAPLYRAVVDVHGSLAGAQAGNRSTLLRREGNRVELTIDDTHEVLVLRGEFP